VVSQESDVEMLGLTQALIFTIVLKMFVSIGVILKETSASIKNQT
jgi:hypothetical protein